MLAIAIPPPEPEVFRWLLCIVAGLIPWYLAHEMKRRFRIPVWHYFVYVFGIAILCGSLLVHVSDIHRWEEEKVLQYMDYDDREATLRRVKQHFDLPYPSTSAVVQGAVESEAKRAIQIFVVSTAALALATPVIWWARGRTSKPSSQAEIA